MNNEQLVLLKLLEAAATRSPLCVENIEPPDWETVFLLACDSKIDGLLFTTVSELQKPFAPDDEFLSTWKTVAFQKSFRQLNNNIRLFFLLETLEAQGTAPVLFKGVFLADLYETPSYRFSSDADILLEERHLPAAQRVMESLGYQHIPELSKDAVNVWQMPGELRVELHTLLWEDYRGSRVDSLRDMALDKSVHLITLTSFNANVRGMGATEHLIYLMYHLIKHMVYRGVMLRDFLDVSLFVNRHYDELDAERFWDSMKILGYDGFCRDMFGSCVQLFGMNKGFCPQAGESDPHSFLDEFMTYCIKNTRDGLNNVASDIIFRSSLKRTENSADGGTAKVGRLQILLRLCFPGTESLSSHYSYAKRFPILLPFAWIHRALQLAFVGREGMSGADNVKKSLDILNSRKRLLSRYNLLD